MKKFSLRKIFYDDKRLKLFSIIAAILFWLFVVSNISPNYSRTIRGIPILTSENGQALTFSGYTIINLSQQSISLEVSGPRSVIGSLSSDDFTVKPSALTVKTGGTYSVRLDVSFKSPDSRVKIKAVKPSAIKMYLDKIVTRSIPVTVKVDSGALPDGYVKLTPTANPASVKVTGPELKVGNIKKAVATIKIDDNANDTVSADSNIEFLNSDGKKADTRYYKSSDTNAAVTVPIVKFKYVPLTVGFSNVPAGFSTSNLSYSLSPAKAKVGVSRQVTDALSSINLTNIDFMSLDLQNTLSYAISVPEGATLLEKSNVCEVTVSLLNTDERTMDSRKIVTANMPAGYGAEIQSASVPGIRLYGPSPDITALKDTDVETVVDMSRVSGLGLKTVPVSIQVPGKTGYWVKGQYTASIYVYKLR